MTTLRRSHRAAPRRLKVALAAGALVIGACGPPPLPLASAPADHRPQAQPAVPGASAEELRRQLDAQIEFAGEYADALAGVLTRLRELNGEELEIASMLQGEIRIVEVDYPAEIARRLDDLAELLSASRSAAGALRALLAEHGVDAESFEQVMRELARILDERERSIASLRAQVEELRRANLVLAERNSTLELAVERESRDAARERARAGIYEQSVEAWVLIASSSELADLRRRELLRSRWGVLEVVPSSLASRGFEGRFRRFDPAEREIALPAGTRKAELRSVQKKYPNLFDWKRAAGGGALAITDPVAFWQASRFLVIEVR